MHKATSYNVLDIIDAPWYIIFFFFFSFDEKKQKSRATEKKAKNVKAG